MRYGWGVMIPRAALGGVSKKEWVFLVEKGVGTLAIYSPILGEARGKIGGLVFSRNKGGPYFRRHAVPTNPNSTRQQTTRNWLAEFSEKFAASLEPAERTAWNDYATMHDWLNSLGQSIKLTGLAWYVMVNSRLRDASGTLIDLPGDLSMPDPFTTVELAMTGASAGTLTFTPVLAGTDFVQLWGLGPLGVAQNPNFRQMRLIGYSPVGQASPWAFTIPWVLVAGQYLKIFAGVMSARGMVSTMLSDRAVWG